MILIVAATFCLQFSSGHGHIDPVPADARDLLFLEAQEDFVYDAVRPYRLDQVISAAEAAIVRRLGCTHYACRVDAKAHLDALPDGGLRAILWGRRSTDPEVRDYCRQRWSEMFLCKTCEGTGLPSIADWEWQEVCPKCLGTGDVRRAVILDDDRRIKIVDRPLPGLAPATVQP